MEKVGIKIVGTDKWKNIIKHALNDSNP